MSKETLRDVVRCLRETGRYVDEEGEATNSLQDLLDAADPLAWAVSRWQIEVSQRPLVNVHRRALDETWRQVVRHFGGAPDTLLGPSHDALIAARDAAAPHKPHAGDMLCNGEYCSRDAGVPPTSETKENDRG